MFNAAKTSREQGDIGLTFAIFKLSQLGYPVSIPITDNNPYDLVIEMNGNFKSVQVKTTGRKVSSGNYEVQLRRIRPNRSENIIHKFNNTDFDFVFIMTSDGDSYMIPAIDITNASTITLYEKYEKYKL